MAGGLCPKGPGDRDRDVILLAAGQETGFWDDQGNPAPWPDDIDEWTPTDRGGTGIRDGSF